MKTKHQATVWTLSWDTRNGTNCRAFGSEEDWFQFFREIIESSIADWKTPEADQIRAQLAGREIGLAYEHWQETYKPDLDTYNWDTQEIMVEILSASQNH